MGFPLMSFFPLTKLQGAFQARVLSVLCSSGLLLHYIRSPEHQTCPSRGIKARCMQYAVCSSYVLVQRRWGEAMRGGGDKRKANNVARNFLFTTQENGGTQEWETRKNGGLHDFFGSIPHASCTPSSTYNRVVLYPRYGRVWSNYRAAVYSICGLLFMG